MQCCFIGHRTIQNREELECLLKITVLKLINRGVTTFLFGSKSAFNDLAWEVVTELKARHPSIKRVYVRASYQYIDKTYRDYLREAYEETYFPSKLEGAGKCSYVKRNYEMIDNSRYCVFYYNEKYIAPLRKINRKALMEASRNSGTKVAYNYAVKNKKIIINLYNQQGDLQQL